jgi:hypothetical protein
MRPLVVFKSWSVIQDHENWGNAADRIDERNLISVYDGGRTRRLVVPSHLVGSFLSKPKFFSVGMGYLVAQETVDAGFVSFTFGVTWLHQA